MNFKKLKEDFKIYCLKKDNSIVENDKMVNLALIHFGVYIPLITITEGRCTSNEEFDVYIVDNSFYNYIIYYTIKTPLGCISLPIGDDSEISLFNFGVKIVKNNNKYELIYGYEDFNEFKSFDEEILYGDDEFLKEFITLKMKNIISQYQ